MTLIRRASAGLQIPSDSVLHALSRPTGRLDAEALARERQLLERSWKNTVATCLIATILKHRTPGMSLSRMPLFVWSMLVTSLMILFAMPT